MRQEKDRGLIELGLATSIAFEKFVQLAEHMDKGGELQENLLDILCCATNPLKILSSNLGDLETQADETSNASNQGKWVAHGECNVMVEFGATAKGKQNSYLMVLCVA